MIMNICQCVVGTSSQHVCVCFSQAFTVTACVLRAAGGRTAPCPVTVRMERRAHPTRARASARLDSEEPPVSAVSTQTHHVCLFHVSVP